MGTVVQIVAQSVNQSNGTSLVSLVCLFEAGKRGHFDPARPCLLPAGLGPLRSSPVADLPVGGSR